MPISLKQLGYLRECIDYAETWRVTMVGNPDKTQLRAFDELIENARVALTQAHADRDELRLLRQRHNVS